MDVLNRWAVWARANLPGGPNEYAAKASQEWDEFVADPTPEEAADVIMCLASFIEASGADPAVTVETKFRRNRCRTWQQNEDGTFQHVELSWEQLLESAQEAYPGTDVFVRCTLCHNVALPEGSIPSWCDLCDER